MLELIIDFTLPLPPLWQLVFYLYVYLPVYLQYPDRHWRKAMF